MLLWHGLLALLPVPCGMGVHPIRLNDLVPHVTCGTLLCSFKPMLSPWFRVHAWLQFLLRHESDGSVSRLQVGMVLALPSVVTLPSDGLRP